MNGTRHTLSKDERLNKKKAIDALFGGGNLSFAAYPFRAVFQATSREDVAVRILVSIPKHRLRHAVDRNRMKRLAREVYRMNKDILTNTADELNCTVNIAFICISNNVATYREVQKSITRILQRTAEALVKRSKKDVPKKDGQEQIGSSSPQ